MIGKIVYLVSDRLEYLAYRPKTEYYDMFLNFNQLNIYDIHAAPCI
jgi:hypothetical protein